MIHEDIISKLPRDILMSIISRLDVQEATSTCILSKSWRHLHTYVTHLNFLKYRYETDTLSNYVNMVDHVLKSHRGNRIKKFKLRMPGGGNFENWFEFAITKKAEIIHLGGVGNFDYEGLFLRLPNKNNGFDCLKNLYLSHSKMTDHDFELLISNCLVLECLAIVLCIKLKNVSIVGHSKLKHLNLSFLWGIGSIMIRDAINLLSLTCCEWRIGCSVQLSNIPKLSKLDVRDNIRNKVTHVQLLDGMPSCVRDQLQLLRLSSKAVSMYELNLELLKNSSLQLVNIKHLELVLDMSNDPNWYYFPRYACRLVEACRSLQKLVIKFLHTPTLILTEFETETYGHPGCDLSQKYLEISGYSGSSSERELTLYVFSNATALQKLTVVACDEEALSRARLDFEHINSVSFFSY